MSPILRNIAAVVCGLATAVVVNLPRIPIIESILPGSQGAAGVPLTSASRLWAGYRLGLLLKHRGGHDG